MDTKTQPKKQLNLTIKSLENKSAPKLCAQAGGTPVVGCT